jgi:hypothetical protein
MKERPKNDEEREWEAYDPNTGEVLGTTKDFSITNATNYFRDEMKLDRFQVREREPEPTSPRAKLAKRIKTPKSQSAKQELSPDGVPMWQVYEIESGHVVHTFANLQQSSAQTQAQQWLRSIGAEYPDLFAVRPKIDAAQAKDDNQDSEQLQARIDPAVAQIPRDWEFYRAETGAVIDRVSDASMMQANAVRADIVRRYGHPDASVRMRSVPTAASAERARARVQDQEQEPNVAQNFSEPQDTQLAVQGVPSWEIYNVNTNQVVRTFFQRDYQDAMVYAGQWLEANDFGLEGYGVRPTMETP